MTQAALVVDRKGLAKKLGDRPKSFVLFELIQNSWDAPGVTEVIVLLEHHGGGRARLYVSDDSPGGFTSLESVYTLFRDSEKASDPTKRGRFELGEKLIAALALRMKVTTTKGTVTIEGDKRSSSRARLERGSAVEVILKMSKEELVQVIASAKRLIVPANIKTFLNGTELPKRELLAAFEATLQTVHSDGEGVLRPTQRKTAVCVYEPAPGEVACLYEMGIPVVETGDRYSYDVGQRVPVNFERNNVPPAYLKTLRVAALNATHAFLPREDALAPWVSDALDDARCAPEAVQEVVQARFGSKAVIHDPSDPEGTKIAVTKGYTVVSGGAFSAGAWDNIRRSKALLPAGQVTPSPKPYSVDGHPEKVIERKDWTPDMGCRAMFCHELCDRLIGKGCHVVIVNEPTVSWLANFGPLGNAFRLCLNYGRLGKKWFALPNRSVEVLDLLLHEYCHATVSDHLSHEMHETATKLGAQLTNWALNDPDFFA